MPTWGQLCTTCQWELSWGGGGTTAWEPGGAREGGASAGWANAEAPPDPGKASAAETEMPHSRGT